MTIIVLRAITRLNIGGPARHAILLSEALGDHGFESHLVAGSESPEEGRIEPTQISYTRIPGLVRPTRPLSDVRAYRALRREISAVQPDIVHTHMAKAGALGRMAARREDVPLIVHTFHGHVLEGYFHRRVEAALISAERWLAKRTDALIAVSSVTRDELLDLGIGTAAQWHVVPLGLDLTDLLSSRVDLDDAVRRLGLPAGRRYVGIVGRLVPVKNHDLFFQIALEVARHSEDVHFVVAGDGPHRAAVEKSIPRAIQARTHMLGWVRDLPSLYSALHVVVQPSLNEGTPVALIEAGAAQRPVVASNVGGVADVVVDGKTGLLFPSRNKHHAVRQVQELLENPSLGETLGQAGREHVRYRYSHRRLISDMAELYGELVQRKEVGSSAG